MRSAGGLGERKCGLTPDMGNSTACVRLRFQELRPQLVECRHNLRLCIGVVCVRIKVVEENEGFFGVLLDLCLLKLKSADDILTNDKAVTIPSILVPATAKYVTSCSVVEYFYSQKIDDGKCIR